MVFTSDDLENFLNKEITLVTRTLENREFYQDGKIVGVMVSAIEFLILKRNAKQVIPISEIIRINLKEVGK